MSNVIDLGFAKRDPEAEELFKELGAVIEKHDSVNAITLYGILELIKNGLIMNSLIENMYEEEQ